MAVEVVFDDFERSQVCLEVRLKIAVDCAEQMVIEVKRQNAGYLAVFQRNTKEA